MRAVSTNLFSTLILAPAARLIDTRKIGYYSDVMPECFRLIRRFAAEARWAYWASKFAVGKTSGFPPRPIRKAGARLAKARGNDSVTEAEQQRSSAGSDQPSGAD